MNAVIEDALVDWYETECVARMASAEARRGDVIDLNSLRHRQSPALARLFSVVEETVASMSLLQPAVASERRQLNTPAESRAHA